ncbi:transposase [Paenibacillus sacheonensis]|nr:transposase [Paenibacillus sacheonensis]
MPINVSVKQPTPCLHGVGCLTLTYKLYTQHRKVTYQKKLHCSLYPLNWLHRINHTIYGIVDDDYRNVHFFYPDTIRFLVGQRNCG